MFKIKLLLVLSSTNIRYYISDEKGHTNGQNQMGSINEQWDTVIISH